MVSESPKRKTSKSFKAKTETGRNTDTNKIHRKTRDAEQDESEEEWCNSNRIFEKRAINLASKRTFSGPAIFIEDCCERKEQQDRMDGVRLRKNSLLPRLICSDTTTARNEQRRSLTTQLPCIKLLQPEQTLEPCDVPLRNQTKRSKWNFDYDLLVSKRCLPHKRSVSFLRALKEYKTAHCTKDCLGVSMTNQRFPHPVKFCYPILQTKDMST